MALNFLLLTNSFLKKLFFVFTVNSDVAKTALASWLTLAAWLK